MSRGGPSPSARFFTALSDTNRAIGKATALYAAADLGAIALDNLVEATLTLRAAAERAERAATAMRAEWRRAQGAKHCLGWHCARGGDCPACDAAREKGKAVQL